MPEPNFSDSAVSEPMQRCEYFLVRYAPSPLRDEAVAIGLLLLDESSRLVRHGMTRDWRTVRCLDPQADPALLESLSQHFDQMVRETSAPDGLRENLRRMEEEFSGTLQISPPRGVETRNPEEEFGRLFREYVAPRRAIREKRPAREGSRPWVQARLREALERRALWDRLEKDIPVEEFTAPGDAFRIDLSYRPNGVVHFLHSLSLERDWNQSKLLSYTFWRVREKTPARMTAIVADAAPAASGCRRILEEARIAIQPLSGIDPFLEQVSRELRQE